ncbi:MAG: hypothetical protein UV73_C0002G0077 [Candidatus Gottesmanbacteria bacterium GW2011_GWA2_43_14]|uniref:ATP-grasp domain-containing protein n=1 Tax=Candidatus Gottesmanbacteria bacterium GW2011_GWA2_43_14 TaxID=1618443 RepID=A0A0G1GHT8_9BACT|nr:MAG: hypothetical protein UV73_C0002G0077 [Candidatus Gottesmanbacteria bacterium GW2011_GWA2_43_14]
MKKTIVKDSSVITIYISNMSEDVWPFIQSISNPYVRQTEIIENTGLAEHDLFSFTGMENIVMVLPKPVKEKYIKYFLGLSGNKNFKILTPKLHTGEISKDIVSDSQLLDELVSISRRYTRVEFISYTNSSQFLHLVSTIRERGVVIHTPESPVEADSWTVDFFGSKSGIRQLSQQSGIQEPDFKMPPGLISIDIENTAKMAAKMYVKENGIVIKTNKGHAGAGLLIFRENDLPKSYNECVGTILNTFRKETYWNKFPIIVEKYIDPAVTIGGGYPNAEFKINKNGRVEFLYYCAMRISASGIFKGVEINNTVLSDQDTAQIMDTGFFLGEQLASRGYRGYYEIDFVASKNGDIFVTESNVRRTGGTHAYHLARYLFGKDFMYDTYILTNNLYPIKKSGPAEEANKLFEILSPILYDPVKKEGIVITGTRLMEQNYLGYVIFGNTRSRAEKIEAAMDNLLAGLGSQ